MYSESMLESYQWFFGKNYWIILTIIIYALLIWHYRKNKRILWLSGCFVFLYFCGVNALTKSIATKIYPGADSTFYRLFWILPIVLFLTCMILLYLKKRKKEVQICVVLSLFVIFIAVMFIRGDFFRNGIPGNQYYVVQDIIDLSDMMEQDEDKNYIKYIGDVNVFIGLEAYSVKSIFPFYRDVFRYYDQWSQEEGAVYAPIFNSVLYGKKASKKERKEMKELLGKMGIDYLIINKENMIENYYEKLGYYYKGETGSYILYKMKEEQIMNSK